MYSLWSRRRSKVGSRGHGILITAAAETCKKADIIGETSRLLKRSKDNKFSPPITKRIEDLTDIYRGY